MYIDSVLVYMAYTVLVLIQIVVSTKICVRDGTACSLPTFYTQVAATFERFIILAMNFLFHYLFKFVEGDRTQYF